MDVNESTKKKPSPPTSSCLYSPMLLRYREFEHVKAFHSSSLNLYKNFSSELLEKEESLANFNSACTKNAIPPATMGLPKSLKLRAFELASFPTIASQPDFFKKERDDLRMLEAETTSKFIAVLLKSKERHVEHLQQIVFREEVFIAERVALFRALVEKDHTRFGGTSSSSAAAAAAASASSVLQSASIPTEEAIAAFTEQFTTEVRGLRFEHFERRVAIDEAKAKRLADELAAKQKVVSGSNTREVIADLSKKVSKAAILPVERELAQVKEKLRQAEERMNSMHVAAAAHSSKRHIDYSQSTNKPAEPPPNKRRVDDAAAAAASSFSSPSSHDHHRSSNRERGDRSSGRGPVTAPAEHRESHRSSGTSRAQPAPRQQDRPRDSERSSKDAAPSSKK